MFPLRGGRSLYPKLSTFSSCRDLRIGTVVSTPGISGPSQAGRGGSSRGGSTTTGRGRGRGAGGRGSTRLARYRVVFVLRLEYFQSHSRRQMHHRT